MNSLLFGLKEASMIFKKGFSLIEILLCVFVLSLGSVSVFKLYSYIEVEKQKTRMRMTANYLLQKQISLMKTINATSGKCGDIKTINQDCMITLSSEESLYVLSWQVKEDIVTPTYIKIIEVEVSWHDRNKQAQSLKSLVTVSKYTNLYD